MINMKVSKFTFFFAVYSIISSYFMQEAWNTWKRIFGVKLLLLFFALLSLAAICGILYKSAESKLKPQKAILILAICIWGFMFAWKQPYLSEKAHVLEFGLLGWLVMRDLSKTKGHLLKSILAGFIFVAMAGFLSEGYQKFLPWRVFEVRDIVTNILSGGLGIILYQLSQAGLSAFVRPF